MNRAFFRTLLLLAVLLGFSWLGQSRSTFNDASPEAPAAERITDALGAEVLLPSSGLVGTAAGIGLFLLGAWIISR